jgi:hypothetical protein
MQVYFQTWQARHGCPAGSPKPSQQ